MATEITHRLDQARAPAPPPPVSSYAAVYAGGDGPWRVSIGYTGSSTQLLVTRDRTQARPFALIVSSTAAEIAPLLDEEFATWLAGFLDKTRQMEAARLAEPETPTAIPGVPA